MSKFGSLWRKSRALEFSLLENKKEFSRGKKRSTPPGIHGSKRKRKSTYALQNNEKQKIRFLYGMRERQLYNLFKNLKKVKGNIGDNLLIFCESRLDNVIFRSGLTGTRKLARQMVSHGHFLLDGKSVKSPSMILKQGQVITFKKKEMTNNNLIKESLESNKPIPAFISLDRSNNSVTFIRRPNGDELNREINIPLAVE
jgi:small subunit ribosomal protein S4